MNKRELLDEYLDEGALVFDNPEYDCAIIGVSHDGRVIYDFDKMCEYLHEKDGISIDDAVEFIEYNTIGAFCGSGCLPIVMYPIYDE